MPYIAWNITRQQFVESSGKTQVFPDQTLANFFVLRRTCATSQDGAVSTLNALLLGGSRCRVNMIYPSFKDLIHDTFELIAVQ